MAQGVDPSHNHGGADRANNETQNTVYQFNVNLYHGVYISYKGGTHYDQDLQCITI